MSDKEKLKSLRESKGAAIGDEDIETAHYWTYSPGNGAVYWDEFYNAGIMAIGCHIYNYISRNNILHFTVPSLPMK